MLISLPKPDNTKTAYHSIAEKHQVDLMFRSFTEVQGLSLRDFRKYHINPLDFTAIIFTSRLAITHFFRLCSELRIKMPEETKYFCITEVIALYLQNHIHFRKRKVFYPKNDKKASLEEILKKHRKEEKYLLPCAAQSKGDLTDFLKDNNFKFEEAPMFETVAADLSDLREIKVDLIVFFSPLAIESMLKNFPDFQQNDTLIAAFGPATCQSVEQHNLRLDIKAPAPEAPSVATAIENYIKGTPGKNANANSNDSDNNNTPEE